MGCNIWGRFETRCLIQHQQGEQMNRKGFTLIELLIVVVIIGILAAIAIPKFANTKEKAYISSMKSDLRNMVTAEEAYFADSVKYTTSTSCVNPAPAGNAAWCATVGNGRGTITVGTGTAAGYLTRSEEHTSELQSRLHLVCRLLLEKKKKPNKVTRYAIFRHT